MLVVGVVNNFMLFLFYFIAFGTKLEVKLIKKISKYILIILHKLLESLAHWSIIIIIVMVALLVVLGKY